MTENILFFVGKETEENIWRRRKNGEGKGGKYLVSGEEKRRRKRRKILGEGKYFVSGREGKGDIYKDIWRGRIFGQQRRKKWRRKKRKIFGE